MRQKMNIRDLKYLVSLADHQHFGKAAEACFVSQPALSMQIQKLEEILGIKLLERTNKSLLFTKEGHAILDYARDILTKVDELYDFAKSAKDPYSCELKIGIFPTIAPYLLPLIVPTLSKKFPRLSLYLIEDQTDFLIDKLKNGKLDAAFLAHPIVEKNFKKVVLFDEEFLLAAPRNHALAKLKSVKQDDLNNQKLLLLEEGHCLREQALALCRKLNAKEAQHFKATSLETLRHMVASGVGMTLMPKLACDTNNNVAYVPFAAPRPTRSICLAWRETTAKYQLLLEITGSIKNALVKQKTIKVII
jgi:LysR family hydrogen peroxide-inducible transcriptional activator